MDKLYIGFSKPKNNKFPIFSWAIRLVENTPYSHVYIKWHSDYLERDIIYQASGSSVNFMEGSYFNNKAETLYEYEINIPNKSSKIAKQKAMDYSNRPYGIKQIFGILIVKIAKLFNKEIKNPFSDGKATWVCSEIVANILIELGYNINISLDNVTPKDIYNFLESIKKNGENKI